MKKRFLSNLENSLFQSVIILKVSFRRNKKAISFRFGIIVFEDAKLRKLLESCFVYGKIRFVSESENSIFQGWQNGNRFMFFWRSEKAIRLRFGKFDFSGRQNARSPVNVVLVPWKSDFFRIRKIRYFRALVRRKEKAFLSDSENSDYVIPKRRKLR